MFRSALLAALALVVFVSPAIARPSRMVAAQTTFLERLAHYLQPSKQVRYAGVHGVRHIRRSAAAAIDGRPAECRGIGPWCGCWLRLRYGIADAKLNLARAWARIGNAVSGPVVGAIAVWPHHVGEITAVPGPGRIVLKSGNDGGAVRERERSTRGVIAYRVI